MGWTGNIQWMGVFIYVSEVSSMFCGLNCLKYLSTFWNKFNLKYL